MSKIKKYILEHLGVLEPSGIGLAIWTITLCLFVIKIFVLLSHIIMLYHLTLNLFATPTLGKCWKLHKLGRLQPFCKMFGTIRTYFVCINKMDLVEFWWKQTCNYFTLYHNCKSTWMLLVYLLGKNCWSTLLWMILGCLVVLFCVAPWLCCTNLNWDCHGFTKLWDQMGGKTQP